jgi:AcrR family transcriptional regulator
MVASSTRRYSPRRPREERREQLLDAALRLVDARGFDAFSIEAVAREADLAKSVVYATFGTREDLLRALVDREIDRAMLDVAAAVPKPPYGDPDAMLRAGLTRIVESVRAQPGRWRLFVLPADGMPFAARENVTRHRRRLLASLQPPIASSSKALGIGHLDEEIVSHMLIACFEQAIRMALTDPKRFTPERLLRFTDDFIAAVALGAGDRRETAS